MMNLLKVSRRTVYRELENLETSLASMGATLEKVARGRFSIQADEAAMTEIQAAILEKRHRNFLLWRGNMRFY